MDEYILLKEVALLLKQQQYDDAAQLYQKIGETYEQKHAFQKALAAYHKSSSLIPHPDSFLSIARVYEKIHQTFSAYEALNHAFTFFTQKKAFDQALEIGFKMSHLQPQIHYPFEKIAEIYFLMGHLSEAAETFQTASLHAFEMKDPKKSLELLFYAFKMTPQNKNIWRQLRQKIIEREGSKSLELVKLDEQLFSVKATETVTKTEDPPHKKEVCSTEEIIHSLEKDLGLRDLSKPQKISAPRIETPLQELSDQMLYDLAIAYKEMGFFSVSIELLQKTLESLSDKDPLFKLNCILTMGICYTENRQFFEAISLLEKTLHHYEEKKNLDKLSKDYRLSILYYLALAFEASENFKKALFFLRKIEKENNKYRDIEERIKKMRDNINS